MRVCSQASARRSARIGRRFCSTFCTISTITTSPAENSSANAWWRTTGTSPPEPPPSVDAWLEDFRQDLPKNTVPTLILHGDADRILPPDATSRRQAKLLANVRFVELPGGPHGVLWTHAEKVNAELVSFLD